MTLWLLSIFPAHFHNVKEIVVLCALLQLLVLLSIDMMMAELPECDLLHIEIIHLVCDSLHLKSFKLQELKNLEATDTLTKESLLVVFRGEGGESSEVLRKVCHYL